MSDVSAQLTNRRNPYAGVLQILSYNRAFYGVTVLALISVAAVSSRLPFPLQKLAQIGSLVALLWLLVSLVVSHYIYDRSGLYRLEWLHLQPAHCLNIHAGLDETTGLLRTRFPSSTLQVFDIFDPNEMTEPSIAQARKVSSPNTQAEHASWKHLPAASKSADAIFLVFAAHELRRPESRAAFFREVARVLQPEGRLIVVEHLRDTPNFLAYGPGFLHFHSRRAWLATFSAANLHLARERRLNPWVRLFELTPSAR